ncbi:MAG TPA: hypothetical protein VK522_09585 [Pseudolabrys sp.]|nr:hypothetical protein [Pseudolabrys sp.]
MKKFLTIVVLLTAVATPAFAQSFNPTIGSGNELPFTYASYARDNGHSAFAQAPQNEPTDTSRNSAVNAWTDHGDLGGSVHNGYVVDGY